MEGGRFIGIEDTVLGMPMMLTRQKSRKERMSLITEGYGDLCKRVSERAERNVFDWFVAVSLRPKAASINEMNEMPYVLR